MVYDSKEIGSVNKLVDVLDIISPHIVVRKLRIDYVARCPFCKDLQKTQHHSGFQLKTKI